MKTCLCGGIWLLLFAAWLGGHDRTRAAGDGRDDVVKKLQNVEKELEHLRQREQDLLRLRDQLRQQAAKQRAEAPKAKDREKLQGAWALQTVQVTAMEAMIIRNEDLKGLLGEQWKDLHLTFEGGHVTVRTGSRPDPRRVTYKLDPTKTPKHLDFDGRLALAQRRKEHIYKWEGDRLVLGFALGELVGGGTWEAVRRTTVRPRDFIATPETAAPVVMTFQRVKP
jgi:uncharacterized protein (TIGR03067 family)